jgi:hypothetical protein
MKTETDPVSERCCVFYILEFRTMEEVQKLSNSKPSLLWSTNAIYSSWLTIPVKCKDSIVCHFFVMLNALSCLSLLSQTSQQFNLSGFISFGLKMFLPPHDL